MNSIVYCGRESCGNADRGSSALSRGLNPVQSSDHAQVKCACGHGLTALRIVIFVWKPLCTAKDARLCTTIGFPCFSIEYVRTISSIPAIRASFDDGLSIRVAVKTHRNENLWWNLRKVIVARETSRNVFFFSTILLIKSRYRGFQWEWFLYSFWFVNSLKFYRCHFCNLWKMIMELCTI